MNGKPERSGQTPESYAFLDFRLDAVRGMLFHGLDEIDLRPKSYETLRFLVTNGGRLVTRAELMQAVWADVAVSDESITKCIADIRKALGDESQEMVRTVKGRGFLFQPEVRTVNPASPTSGEPMGAADALVSSGWIKPAKRAAVPWIILAVAAVGLGAGAVYWYFARGGRAAPVQSIVVLPFVNMSGDPNEEFLSDCITEEITDTIARISGLRVVARTSAFQFKGKALDIRKLGQHLGVDAVLEGSMRQAEGKLRITAQLDSGRDGYHLWSRTWERDTKDIVAVEREIAQAVVQTVQRSAKGLPPPF